MVDRELARLLRPEEFSELAGISRSYGYKLIAAGSIPCVRMGKSVRIPFASYLDFVKRNTTGGTEEAA